MKKLINEVQEMYKTAANVQNTEASLQTMSRIESAIDESITDLTRLKELTTTNMELIATKPRYSKTQPAQFAWMLAVELYVMQPGCFDDPLNLEIERELDRCSYIK